MGKRVHVVSKQAEYGATKAFNWANEEFKDLLHNCGATVYCEECSDEFELSVGDYERSLTILKRMKENPDLTNDDLADLKVETEDGQNNFDPDLIDIEDINVSILKLDCTIEELIEILESFYEERDKNSDWVEFSAF